MVSGTGSSEARRVDTFAEDAGRAARVARLAVLVLDVHQVEGVDVAGEVTQTGQQDVDEEVGAAACHDRDCDWRHWEGVSEGFRKVRAVTKAYGRWR